jgi:hypothetical protein
MACDASITLPHAKRRCWWHTLPQEGCASQAVCNNLAYSLEIVTMVIKVHDNTLATYKLQ